MRTRIIALLSFSIVLTLSGCYRNWCRSRPYYDRGPRTNIPPTQIPDVPPPMAPPPGGAVPRGSSAELLMPQPFPTRDRDQSRFGPSTGEGSAILGSPESDPITKPVPVPESSRSPKNTNPTNPPAETGKSAPVSPPAPMNDADSTGISGFAVIKEGIATGRRPEIAGLDVLKERKYSTIVYLRAPDDDETTDRRQVERREMRFETLLAVPETLTQKWIDEFNKLAGDPFHRPIFIYDRDGSIAPAIWYAHFRTAEFLTHDEAEVRATRLGLQKSSPLYQAVLKLLAKP